MPFLGNQYNCVPAVYPYNVHSMGKKKNRERRGVCRCRVTILLKYRYGGIAHTAAVLRWMNKKSLGMAGEGGKGEWNKERKTYLELNLAVT